MLFGKAAIYFDEVVRRGARAGRPSLRIALRRSTGRSCNSKRKSARPVRAHVERMRMTAAGELLVDGSAAGAAIFSGSGPRSTI
jgi:hypothetical protein